MFAFLAVGHLKNSVAVKQRYYGKIAVAPVMCVDFVKCRSVVVCGVLCCTGIFRMLSIFLFELGGYRI